MARKPKLNMARTALAKKPHRFDTEYFSDQDIERILHSTKLTLEGAVSDWAISDGKEITRKEMLKREINSLASYWRGKIAMQINANTIDMPLLMPPYEQEENPRADHLFDHLILSLGQIWTDPNIFAQNKVATSNPSSEKLADGYYSAYGPFIRFSLACCEVIGINKTANAVRAAIRKSPDIFKELTKEEREKRRAEYIKLWESTNRL